MKRLVIYLVLMVLTVFFAGVNAYVQERIRPQLGNRDEHSQGVSSPEALPQSHLSQSHIFLNGYLLDTDKEEPLAVELPADLRQTRMAEALRVGAAPAGGLYIVKFVGPVEDGWVETLKGTGAEIVAYIPNNAYVVRTDARAAYGISRMKDRYSFVQWVGDYHGAFRIAPGLRAARELGNQPYVKVTVQVIGSPEGRVTVDSLKRYSQQFFGESRVMNYHNVTGTIPVSQLTALANDDSVFAIEPATERVPLDEAQGQIVAGNLTGNSPSGPGYLAWLASKGFDSSQFNSFAVNVADDAYSLTGHPDLPAGRIAFQNNPTLQSGPQGGHGFLNSHIIGGFNNDTGSPFEDALGFNYGLGIAPWARVGVTAIFGPGTFNPFDYEAVAYSQGSRISSNSWGFISLYDYDSAAQAFDFIVRDAQSGAAGNQQLTVVFSAANDGPASNTVTSPATAKNVITVGASENVRQTGTDGCGVPNAGADSANDIISFSSRGPVNSVGGDGRVKPDIVAPGTHIEAGVPQSNYDGSSVCNPFFPLGQTLYGWSSGTSHSAPAVAGGAALVYQDFLNKGLAPPSPAMVKAVLMNSAAYMNGIGAGGNLPSNSQGMGRLDLGRAFDGSQRILVDQTQVFGSTGETYTATGSVATSAQPFRITLAWTDAPGSTVGAPWVNNLDLEVTVGGQTYRGNVFSGANSTTGGTADIRNNSESVFLPAGVSGNFTVTVRATNIAGDGVPGNADATDQDFALVIYNATSDVSISPAIGVNSDSLSFTATAGDSKPSSQTISITNAGAGLLNWTSSDGATWLTIGSANGVAPTALIASVSIAGLLMMGSNVFKDTSILPSNSVVGSAW
jgi:Subtilase family